MNAQNLSTVICPNVLYSKNNDPTSPNYFDTVMSEGQTFTFIIDQSAQIFPSFDAPSTILPKDQKVPLGAGKLVENPKSEDGSEDDEKKKKGLFGKKKGKASKEDEKEADDRKRATAAKPTSPVVSPAPVSPQSTKPLQVVTFPAPAPTPAPAVVSAAPPQNMKQTSSTPQVVTFPAVSTAPTPAPTPAAAPVSAAPPPQVVKQTSTPQVTVTSAPPPKTDGVGQKPGAPIAGKKAPPIPPKPVGRKPSDAPQPSPTEGGNPANAADDVGEEFSIYAPDADSQFQ